MISSPQDLQDRPLKPTLDHHLLTLSSTLSSLYRIAMTLSPGVFISFYFRLDEGVNHQQRWQQQLDFWRIEAQNCWDDLLSIDGAARESDTAMMVTIGRLMADVPDHPLHSAFERWVADCLPELEYDIASIAADWQSALEGELRELREHCESLRWLHEHDRGHFVAKRFVDCRNACKHLVDKVDHFLALVNGTRHDVAVAIMPHVREVSDAFHQAWCYDIQGQPELAPVIDAQVNAALQAIKMPLTGNDAGDQLVWSAETVSKQLSISISHVWALNTSGRLPRPVKFGNSSRWCATELTAWVEAGCPSRDRWEQMRKGKGGRR